MSSPWPWLIRYTCQKLYKDNFGVVICLDILAECTKKRVVRELSELIRFLETVSVFYFLLAFYFRILI